MKCKLIIGAMALFVTAGAVSAQGFATSKFGVKGGWNSANITNSKEGDVDNSKRLNTFNAGVVAAIPLGSTFEIRTGLDLQSKGIKATYKSDLGEGTLKSNPMYLELPVNISFMLPLNEKVKAYVGAGPYAAVGIAGKNTINGSAFGLTSEKKENISWGNDDPLDGDNQQGDSGDDYKRFDFGANIIAGLDFGKFGVHAQYGLGLTNVVPGKSSEKNSNKNNQHRVIGVNGVFYF